MSEYEARKLTREMNREQHAHPLIACAAGLLIVTGVAVFGNWYGLAPAPASERARAQDASHTPASLRESHGQPGYMMPEAPLQPQFDAAETRSK